MSASLPGFDLNFKKGSGGVVLVVNKWDDALLVQLNDQRLFFKEEPGQDQTLPLADKLILGRNYLTIACWNHEGDSSLDFFLDVGGDVKTFQRSEHNYPIGTMLCHAIFFINVTQ
jgi:hypothetical protein